MIHSLKSSIYHFCVCTSDTRPYELYGTGHVVSFSDLLCVASTVGILARGYALKDTPYRALRSRLNQEKRRKSQQRWDLYATLPTSMAFCPRRQNVVCSYASTTTLESRHPP